MKLFLLAVFLLFASLSHAACQVMDDTGQLIHLNRPAARIISLAPDITETLFAIGSGDRIVGVITGSDYPHQVNAITKVGSYNAIDLEKIIALKPDLIITWGKSFHRQLHTLKKIGIPIYTNLPQHLADIPHSMINLGCLSGVENQSKLAANHFLLTLQRLRMQYARVKKVSVFYQIGTYSFITVNKNSWINEVISLCGGENIFANASLVAPEITWEALVVANPDVIISDATSSTWRQHWQSRKELQGVQHQLLFNISPDLIERAGPRLLQGVSLICQNLQLARDTLNKK